MPGTYSTEVDLDADYATQKPNGRKSQMNSPQGALEDMQDLRGEEDSGDERRSKNTNEQSLPAIPEKGDVSEVLRQFSIKKKQP